MEIRTDGWTWTAQGQRMWSMAKPQVGPAVTDLRPATQAEADTLDKTIYPAGRSRAQWAAIAEASWQRAD